MGGARRSWRQVVGAPAAALLLTGSVTAGVLVATVAPASAATDLVTTEAQFRADWNSNAFDTLVLQNDIHLTSPGCTIATRTLAASGPITIDGQGRFSIIQDCAGHGVLIDFANGDATLRGVTITGGSGSDGGVEFAGTTNTNETITGSTFSNNTTTDQGGAVEVDQPGTLTIDHSTFVNNQAPGNDGGAINLDNDNIALRISSSSFLNNQAGDDGGALDCNGVDTMSVVGSTFAGNSTLPGNGNSGGAIDMENDNCALRLVDSTVTKNTSGDDAAVTGADSTGDTMTLVYDTIVNNAASPASPGAASVPRTRASDDKPKVHAENDTTPVSTANVELTAAANLTVFGTVIARPHGGPNCSDNAGAPLTGTASAGYNLADDTSCGLAAATDKQAAGLDPLLGALANNGGPTQTVLPLPGSPLIDAIPVAACQAGPAAGITIDQRGIARPQGPGCDIGAVEVVVPLVVRPRFTG